MQDTHPSSVCSNKLDFSTFPHVLAKRLNECRFLQVSEASKGDVLIGGDDDEESDSDSAEEGKFVLSVCVFVQMSLWVAVDADMDQVELRKVAEMLRGQDFE